MGGFHFAVNHYVCWQAATFCQYRVFRGSRQAKQRRLMYGFQLTHVLKKLLTFTPPGEGHSP